MTKNKKITVKVGQKLKLTCREHFSRREEKSYNAIVLRVTGVAVLIKWRNKYGSHEKWLNRDLQERGFGYTYEAKKVRAS